jgi:hypothetical protein
VHSQLSLADIVVTEAVLFFGAYEEAEQGELRLEVVDERIDGLGMAVQWLDLSRSNPDSWAEHLGSPTSAYEHLWPAQQFLLFLLGNYAALHAAIRKETQVPLMAHESIAWEVLSMEWIQHETTVEGLLEEFLAHPASQVPQSD